MVRGIRMLTAGLLFLFAVICRPAHGAEVPKIFTVGALFPMTGPQAYYGRMMSRGAMTAIDRINSDGGVAGYKLKLEIADFRNLDTDLALNGLGRMIKNKRIPFLLTSFSGVTLAVQPICASKRILTINGGAYSPSLAGRPYLYNIKLIQTQMIPPMLEFLRRMNVRRIGIIHFAGPGGEVPAREVVEPLWVEMGGEVVSVEEHRPGGTNFIPQLSRIKSGNADAVFDISTGTDQGYIIKNARELGMDIPIVVQDWGTDFHDIAGSASENVYVYGDRFDARNPEPSVRRFVREYEEKWEETPDVFAANYYEAVYYILAELIRRVAANGKDPMDGEELEKAIRIDPSFGTLYGDRLVLNTDGTCNKPMAIYKIVNGNKTVLQP